MFSAFHPYKDELITYKAYLQFVLENNFQKSNDAPSARCPVCKGRLKVRAGQKKDDGHFYHFDDLCCPTKESNGKAYHGLPAETQNEQLQVQNRKFAQENIGKIWERLKKIIPFLDFLEFLSILSEAKRLNIYGYANLNPKLLPYVYVTLINYLPSKSKNQQRKLKFCFFYESRIKSYNELWINKGNFPRLIRMSYSRNNQTQKVTMIDISIDYLQNEDSYLTEKQLTYLKNNV